MWVPTTCRQSLDQGHEGEEEEEEEEEAYETEAEDSDLLTDPEDVYTEVGGQPYTNPVPPVPYLMDSSSSSLVSFSKA